ncbi:MAG: hypothetical protein Q9174_005391 [Haloplaca sp. 1 TL-2023]
MYQAPSKGKASFYELWRLLADWRQGNLTSRVRSILSRTSLVKPKDIDPMQALTTSYAQGDPSRAKELLSLIKESEEGIIKPFDPRIKMLGAVNRDNITCFLDALLFAMFMTTECFEKMLYDNPIDWKKKRLASLLRLWVNTLRVGKLITPDLTKQLQLALAESGWEGAAEARQQDASEAFTFITEALELPLLTLKMDIYHHGKEEAGNDHKFVKERMLEVAVPEQPSDGSVIGLEDCLETYFNNRVEIKRYLQQRQPSGSLKSSTSFDFEKGHATHIETVECADSMPSTPMSPMPKRPLGPRNRAPSIIQESYISEKHDEDVPAYESPLNGRRRAGSTRKEVVMPAWQFFSLIPWYTNTTQPGTSPQHTAQPSTDAQVADAFSQERPVLGEKSSISSETLSLFAHENPRNLSEEDDNMSEDAPLFGNFKIILQAAVCHRGTRVDQGHYIGLARTLDPQNPDRDVWMRHDDLAGERVAEVDIKKFLKDETPYLLFYQVVPLDGEAPSTAGSEFSALPDPPAYTPWDSGIGVQTNAEEKTQSLPRTSTSSDQNRSHIRTDMGSITPYTESPPRNSLEIDDSRRSSRTNAIAASDVSTVQADSNRFGASMSRLTGRRTKDKADNSGTSTNGITNGGSSLDVRTQSDTAEKSKLKKEKSKSKLKDHHHLMKGKSKVQKPEKECILM